MFRMLFLFLFSFSAFAGELVTVHPKDGSLMKDLAAKGYDIGGVDLENRTFGILFKKDVDKQKFIKRFGKRIKAVAVSEYSEDGSYSLNQYMTLEKVEAKLRELVSGRSDIAQMFIAGHSLEGKPIWAVKISPDLLASTAEVQRRYNGREKRRVLFDAMHHAREVMTPEVAVDIVDYILNSDDPRVATWLEKNDIWVLPMVNPDGNHKVHNGSSMWRKNARGGYGVDINRNYPSTWNKCNGSSGSRSSETYRGESAGSEPETQVMVSVFEMVKPHVAVSYHSYSEIVIYPGGCQGEQPDQTVRQFGKDLALKLKKDSGNGVYSAGMAWELLYSVDGGSVDEWYTRYGTKAYVIEVNSQSQGFQPDYDRWRNKTVEAQRAGWQFVLDSDVR